MSKSHRGTLSTKWLQECEEWRLNEGLSLRELAKRATTAINRERPFASATVHQYLRGTINSDDLTIALAKLRGVSPPAVSGRDPELQEWCDLGARFKAETEDRFREELDAVRKMVEAMEKFRRR